MELSTYFSLWDKLDEKQRQLLEQNSVLRHVPKGTIVHNGNMHCTGLILVASGQLRGYILSEEGREITVYRMFERDFCLLTATCMLSSLEFDIIMETEKDSVFWVINPDVYKQMMLESAMISNFTNQVMATRLSDVMWLMEQVLWKSFDKRLASFLLQESGLEGSAVLKTTHEAIGNHLGNPREVVTRMLRYFQSEGYVKLTRGTIEILDAKGLEKLAES